MGTIISRTRKDGSTAYLAQILIKRKGKIVFRQSETFDRRQAAKAWLSRRETELRKPGALDQREDPTLSAVIDRYIEESRQIGKTKAQVLSSIKNNYDISATRCSEIDSAPLVDFAKAIPVSPQTRQNYLSHLGAVFAVARSLVSSQVPALSLRCSLGGGHGAISCDRLAEQKSARPKTDSRAG